jgi:transposase InsO family protein
VRRHHATRGQATQAQGIESLVLSIKLFNRPHGEGRGDAVLIHVRTADPVELATAAWVAWWNEQRLHSACGDIPPAEFEAAYHQRLLAATAAA